MEPENIPTPAIENDPELAIPDTGDDSDVDEVIRTSMANLRAEQPEVAVPPESAKAPEAPATASADALPTTAGDSAQPESPTGQKPVYDFQPPIRKDGESDAAFELRTDLNKLVALKKAATTPNEIQEIQNQMNDIRKQIAQVSSPSINRSPSNNDGAPLNVQTPAIDPSMDSDKPIAQIVEEAIQKRDFDSSVRSTLESFTEKHPELQDPAVREVYFQFIDTNFQWEGKSGKDLVTVLDMAHQVMFRPGQTVQERVLKAADVQTKVNAMQFPGGTIHRTGLTPAQQKSVDEMTATGMSEEKARALILD